MYCGGQRQRSALEACDGHQGGDSKRLAFGMALIPYLAMIEQIMPASKRPEIKQANSALRVA